MDEKLKNKLNSILSDVVYSARQRDRYVPNVEIEIDELGKKIEQAFRDNGRLEPQQPEGELIDACRECDIGLSPCDEAEKANCSRWDLVKAQLAHMKAQGYVKLPSEDEFGLMFKEAYDKALTSTYENPVNWATELLKLLKGEKP